MKPRLLYFNLLLALNSIHCVRGTGDEPWITYEQLYDSGKMTYSRKEWGDCVGFLRRAVEDFNYYNDEVLWCREMCERKFPSNTNAMGMAATHLTAQRALCLFRCKTERLTEGRPASKRHLVWYEMEEREPYRYMHICYWHLGDLKNAVKSAYTYLVRNPGHQETLENLQFYMKQKGFEEEMLDDFQRKEYENLYMSGVDAYHKDDWWSCIDRLERSLEKVLREEELCRMDCKDKIDWSSVEGTLEIDIIQTSMRASVLRCESQCFERLSWVNGHKVRHIIASHFEYMHMCQYNLMRGTDACTSVANYLLFDDSPLMRRNRFAYDRQYKKPELFTPDSKILKLYDRMVLEKQLLEYIDRQFKVSRATEMPPETSKDREKWNEVVDWKDYFPYNEVEKLLSDGECKVLRSPIRTKLTDLLIEELTGRVGERLSMKLSTDSPPHTSCSSTQMEAHCERPLVLSIDEKSCSMWLPSLHQGCSLVFCAA